MSQFYDDRCVIFAPSNENKRRIKMNFKDTAKNVGMSLLLLNAVYVLFCLVTGEDYDFEILHCVITPILCGLGISYGEYLRTKRFMADKNSAEQEV